MKFTSIANLLALDRLGPPSLRVLIPDENSYSACLFQPEGTVQADATGVRNQDRTLAIQQFDGFLQEVTATDVDLAVTPEYSMPWEVLTAAIKNGRKPTQGKLWALGCESIRYSDLETLKDELAGQASLIYEKLIPNDMQFVSPLVYIFWAPSIESNTSGRLVILVQFKTSPMGGTDFEINGLQQGTHIYKFGGEDNHISLLTMICSDVLVFTDADAKASYDRTMILHIQLNPKPRHSQFRGYRSQLFKYSGDSTEIICLNWSKNVQLVAENGPNCWKNMSGSAWYLRPDKFDTRDTTLFTNHKRGLYYTWCQDMRAHALFFNYDPGIFLVSASKAFHHGVTASLSRRSGPKMTKSCAWDSATSAWIDRTSHQDGFADAVSVCGNAEDDIKSLADANPFNAERVLALSVGIVDEDSEWYHLGKLDSCGIDLSEVIQRMTFCQDTDQGSKNFRNHRLMRLTRLWNILTNENVPPALQDLKDGFKLDWAPHQNVASNTGSRATAVYMGDDAVYSDIEALGKRIAEHLRTSISGEDEALEARERFHIWYGDAQGNTHLYDPTRYLKISDPRSSSEFDFTRMT